MASLLFNVAFAISFLLTVKYHWREKHLQKVEPYMQVILWLVSIGSSMVPLFWNMYHNTGPICFVDSYRKYSTACVVVGSLAANWVLSCARKNDLSLLF